MKIKPVAAWYDMWAGLFWDRKQYRLYILPVPMLGIYIQFPRPKVPSSLSEEEREIFERAFSGGIGSCVMDCHCGKTYFDAEKEAYDWEEGEYEELEKNPDAFPTIGCVGQVAFDGIEYVDACDCWHGHARRVIDFINRHDRQIATYFKLEKKRVMDAAESKVEVEGGAS